MDAGERAGEMVKDAGETGFIKPSRNLANGSRSCACHLSPAPSLGFDRGQLSGSGSEGDFSYYYL